MAKAETVEEFDRRFDEGEDIFDLADIAPEDIKRPGLESQRINIDVPVPMLKRIDNQAALRGITRQSLIKAWLYERLMNELAADRASALYNQRQAAGVNVRRNKGKAALRPGGEPQKEKGKNRAFRFAQKRDLHRRPQRSQRDDSESNAESNSNAATS